MTDDTQVGVMYYQSDFGVVQIDVHPLGLVFQNEEAFVRHLERKAAYRKAHRLPRDFATCVTPWTLELMKDWVAPHNPWTDDETCPHCGKPLYDD